MSKIKIPEYPFTIRHLSQEEGGGYLIEFPDLPGCMSDGETIEEAITHGKDAIQVWVETAKQMNKPIPKPGELECQSGKWVQRVPRSIHLRLATKAKEEGVSLNTLVITMLSESLGIYGSARITKAAQHYNAGEQPPRAMKVSEKKIHYKIKKRKSRK